MRAPATTICLESVIAALQTMRSLSVIFDTQSAEPIRWHRALMSNGHRISGVRALLRLALGLLAAFLGLFIWPACRHVCVSHELVHFLTSG